MAPVPEKQAGKLLGLLAEGECSISMGVHGPWLCCTAHAFCLQKVREKKYALVQRSPDNVLFTMADGLQERPNLTYNMLRCDRPECRLLERYAASFTDPPLDVFAWLFCVDVSSWPSRALRKSDV